MKKFNILALVIALLVSVSPFPIQHAHAETLSPLSTAQAGGVLNFADRQWIVLDPSKGYIIESNVEGSSATAFDTDNSQVFDPTKTNNLAYWLNGSFYNSLPNKEWIQNSSWDIGNETNESSKQVEAKVGLISYNDSRVYRSILPLTTNRYWVRTPLGRNVFYVWFVNASGSLSSIVANNSTNYWARPALYLKSNLQISGSGTSADPYMVSNQAPNIQLSNAAVDQTVSLQPGNGTVSISGKAYDPDGGDVTVSATLGGVTKTAIISSVSVTEPGSDNFTLTWDNNTDHVLNGTYNNISVKIDDGNGLNTTDSYSGVITVDTLAPTTPTVKFVSPANYASGAATNQNVSFTIMNGSDSGSGVLKSEYRISENGGSTWEAWTNYTAPVTVLNTGTTSIEAKTIDKAGNESISASAWVLIDKEAPTGTTIKFTSPADYESGSEAHKNISFIITSDTDAGSGVFKSLYRISSNGGATWGAWTDYISPINISSTGVTKIEAKAIDKAGNESAVVSAEVNIVQVTPKADSVLITGTAVAGEILTAHYTYTDENGDAEEGSTYQWYRSDNSSLDANHTAINGAESSTYVLQVDDVDKYISFKITPKNKVNPTDGAAVESVATTKIAAAPIGPIASNVMITGAAVAGQTLTGEYTYFDGNGDQEDGTTFQWYRSDDSAQTISHTAISGAVNLTYELQTEDVGKYISFKVTPKNKVTPTDGAAVESAATAVIIAAPIKPTATNVSITGTAVSGEIVEGHYIYNDGNGDQEEGTTFQWYRSNDSALSNGHTAISGAVSSSYHLQAEDIGKYISFEVTPKNKVTPTDGEAVESAATAIVVVGPTEPTATNVSIIGTTVDGETLTGKYTYNDVNGDFEEGTLFQWYRSDDEALSINHTAISGAVSSEYVLQAEDIGKYISFKITPKNKVTPTNGESVESAATAIILAVPTEPTASNVSITGTAIDGEILTGKYTYNDANGDSEEGSTYQWYRSDDLALSINHTVISGATNSKYVLQTEDIGKYITFKVTPRNTAAPTTGSAQESAGFLVSGRPPTPVATLTSTIGTVSTGGTMNETITNIPNGTTLESLKAAVTPAANATFEVYEADGLTVATTLATGDKVIVTAQDGVTMVTYTVTVNSIVPTPTPTPTPTPNDGGSTPPSDDKVTSTDGNLTVPVGKTGEVSLGGEVIVSIPANATNKELKLTIYKVLETQNLVPNKEVLASPIYEILKNFSENFSNSVTLTFTFDPKSLKSNQKAVVFYYDEVKKEWVEVGGKVNGDKVTVDVNHFTKYAVFAVGQAGELPTEGTLPGKPEIIFSDISRHWAEDNIKQAVNGGIVSGYPDGTFKPNSTVTRAEFAVMLMNTLKLQGEGTTLAFKDSAKIGAWAQKAVAQAVEAGFIKGYEDGTFRPDAEITRAEMAVILANALSKTIEANASINFADDKDIPVWAKDSVAFVKQAGIIQGKNNNRFVPNDPATRSEAVTVLLHLVQMSK